MKMQVLVSGRFAGIKKLHQGIKVINAAGENPLIIKILLVEPIVDLAETKFSENGIGKIKNSNDFHD